MGHLFVAQGDLTKLACEAVVIPCDSRLNVNPVWASLLPPNLPSGESSWWRLPGSADNNGVVHLPDSSGRRIRAVVAVEGRSEPSDVVDRLWGALGAIVAGLETSGGRAVPLVGIALVGTGDGGLKGRRGEVIDEILARHRDSPIAADVALILSERRDFAAVQARRIPNDWSELDVSLTTKADYLGRLAASGQLSLFLGAGVSQPVGLPTWWGLLDKLAEAADLPLPQRSSSPYDEASSIVSKLGDRYHDELRTLLDVPRHSVGHALLASLRVKQTVTTNFDPCMELATDYVLGGRYRVLTRQVSEGDMPWILKLNGDIRRPGSIVLTREAEQKHREESSALHGVVQTLMLTSHLLFVGFSLTDESFLRLASAVTRVRRQAQDSVLSGVGTAIALTPRDIDGAGFKDLDMFSMLVDDSGVAEASRMLEIFLDRLCWKSASEGELVAEYLLDDDYETGLNEADLALRKLLRKLRSEASVAESSHGWKRVQHLLRILGDAGVD